MANIKLIKADIDKLRYEMTYIDQTEGVTSLNKWIRHRRRVNLDSLTVGGWVGGSVPLGNVVHVDTVCSQQPAKPQLIIRVQKLAVIIIIIVSLICYLEISTLLY